MPVPHRAVAWLVVLSVTGCGAATPVVVPPPPPQAAGARELYAAAITLVGAHLRLHETDRARAWLERAPAAYRGWEWHYLAAQADRSRTTVSVGGGSITDVTVSPDGQLVAVAMADGRTHLLGPDGDSLRTLAGPTAAAWTPVFTPDGRRLATASSDGAARVWDVATGRLLLAMPGNGRGVGAAAWSPDASTLAVSSWDRTPERGVWGTLNVYDGRTGERLRHIEHGDYPIASLTYSRDGALLIGGTWDWNLVVWDTMTWAEPRVLPPPESSDYKRIEDFSVSPDGSTLAVAYADGRARIWDLERLEIVQTLHSPTEEQIRNIADVAWLPGGETLATVGGDLTVRLWDAATGALLAVHHGHERPILTVAASPDGRRLYTGGSGGHLRIWDLEALDPARTTWRIRRSPDSDAAGAATAYDVAFDPGGRRAVVTTFEGWLRVLDAGTGGEVLAWRASEEATVGVDWSPDGQWIASTDNDGRVVVWAADTGEKVTELLYAQRQLLNVAFSPDGALLASPGPDSSLVVWSVPSWESVASLVHGAGEVQDVAWGKDGMLAAAANDGTVLLWDTNRRTLEAAFEAGASGTPAIALDPSGRKLAVALGRSVRIRDMAADRWQAEWPARSNTARSISWSPDGDRIAAAIAGNTFEVWDSETGEPVLRIPQTATAWLVTWTESGALVLVPLDQTIRILRPAPR